MLPRPRQSPASSPAQEKDRKGTLLWVEVSIAEGKTKRHMANLVTP